MNQHLEPPTDSAQQARRPSPHLEAWWEALPDAIAVWDRAGTILSLNAAACTLFEIPEANAAVGTSIQGFFQRPAWRDEQDHPFFFAPWLLDLTSHQDEETPGTYEQILQLDLPSTRTVLLVVRCTSLRDAQGQPAGMLALFQEVAPRYQKALHLQRVYEAVTAFNEALTELPEELLEGVSEDHPFFSPPVLFVSQQLVEVIHAVLGCWRVSLYALDIPSWRMAYVAGSGFTNEQEARRRQLGWKWLATDFVDETAQTRLLANQEAIFNNDRFLPMLGKYIPTDEEAATVLSIPLFLERQLAGVLVIRKEGWDRGYSQEEVDLARAVAAQALLLIEWLGSLHKQRGAQAREQVLTEVSRLSNEFLILASHELRTPLTGIKGHLQVAQRRLARLKRTVSHQTAPLGGRLTQIQHTLASTERSVRLLERMVQDLIDDARIQARQFDLTLQPCDLLSVIQTAMANQQTSWPEHVITFENLTAFPIIRVLADAKRIDQVLSIYLTNALTSSPAERPVTVQIQEERDLVRVSVHDEGPGIPPEEQAHLWERFYRGKGSGVQHELDLSLGLSFYLCQVIIERHHGNVGVESELGYGTTFWFALPKGRATDI